MTEPDPTHPQSPPREELQPNPIKQFVYILLGQASFVFIAIIFGAAVSIDPFENIQWHISSLLWGISGAAVIACLGITYAWIFPRLAARLEQTLIYTFKKANLPLNALTIVLISLAAGIGEEVLFRGTLQAWALLHWPLWLALAAPAALFALLHAHSVQYILYVFVFGLLLGLIYWLTNNLLTLILLHTFYDIFALSYLRRLLKKNTLDARLITAAR